MRVLVAVIVICWSAAFAHAERRVALVMGADRYESLRPLGNAVNDAFAMRDTLEALGFEVFLETDRDLRRTRRALEDFVHDAEGADVALVFFAGHGVEVGGVNRLLPVDADASSPAALEATSLTLAAVRETVTRVAPVGLVVLDACRDDPFGMASGAAGRGAASLMPAGLPATVTPGLGRMGRSENVLFAFSAAPGETAADGDGDNSPFTAALTKYLGTDGLEIRSVLTLVQQEVYDVTRGSQLPYVESGLPATFFAATTRGALPERERLLLAMAEVTPAIRDEIEKIAAGHDMPLAPLYGAFVSAGLDALAPADRETELAAAAQAFVETRQRLRLLDSGDPRVARLRSQAEASLALGALDEAAGHLDRAIAIDEEARQTVGAVFLERTLSQAASLDARAGIARTALNHAKAIAVLEEAAALHRQVAALEVPDSARRDRNWLLAELGYLNGLVGDTPAALDAYERMRAAVRARIDASPDEPDARRDLWVSHGRIGDVLVAQGDIAGAKEAYEAGHAIIERLAERDPTRTEWQRDLSVSYNKIGDILRAQGDLAGARRSYRASLDIAERLAETNPRNLLWQRDLSVSQLKIGDVRADQGDLVGALQAFEASRRIAETLAAADPGNTAWQRDVMVSNERIGNARRTQGDLAGALKAYEAGLEIAERLAASDPGNAGWQRDLSVSHIQIGDVRNMRGNLAGATEAYRASLAIAERLAEADADNAEWRYRLSFLNERLGFIQKRQGDLEGALAQYQKSLDRMVPIRNRDPTNSDVQEFTSRVLHRVGDARMAQGDLAGAKESYAAGLAIRQRLAASDPSHTGWQRDLLVSHFKIATAGGGDPQRHLRKALDIAEDLEKTGRLAPSDAFIPGMLRERLEALAVAAE